MRYTVSLTKSGQMTLPKELRDFLGIKPGEKVIINQERTGVSIHRKLTKQEFFAELDKNISPKTRRIAQKNLDKTTSEMLSEYLDSPKGQAEMRRKYAS